MKLLILTQKVDRDDPVLGFFHRWIEEFAKRCERVTVICLKKGEYDLPPNVEVLSLGKESGASRVKYLWRFYLYIWRERKNYDKVFVHMNQVYVILGSLFWKLWGKRVSLWYVHRQTSVSLWFAEKLTHVIFSSTPESFRLKSGKVTYVGHGIPLHPLCPPDNKPSQPTLMHIGRLTPIKRCEILIKAAAMLQESLGLRVLFLGSTTTRADEEYLQSLRRLIEDSGMTGQVEFLGNVPPDEVSDRICRIHATVNLAPTGGMDKAVLESLAVGVPAFVANKAFAEVFDARAGEFIIEPAEPEILARKLADFFVNLESQRVGEITERVRSRFSVEALITKLFEHL